MNALVIWIVVPLIIAVALFFFRRWENAIQIVGISLAFVLAWLAWQLPIGESTSIRLWLGFPALKVGESLTILGQQFTLNDSSRPVIMLIYLGAGFWLAGAFFTRLDRLFVPSSIAISALQIWALSAETFSQIPLILEMIALATVPLLSPPGKPMSRGALRFIIFQTIGACLILISDRWWLPSITTTSASTATPVPLLAMGIGYAFILAVIPTHTWIIKTAEEIDPYIAAFIFYTLPVGIAFLLLKNMDLYITLGAPLTIYSGFLSIGILMALVGGVGAAFERHMGRILGFTALTQIGVLLLAIGLNNPAVGNPSRVGILFSQLIPMGVGLAVWAKALRIFQIRSSDLQLDSVRGWARSSPITAICLLLAQFSLSGLPVLASFPIYAAIWTMLGQQSLKYALLFMIGIALLLAASTRTLAALVSASAVNSHPSSEGKLQPLLLVLGGFVLLIEGLAPQWFVPWLTRLGGIFIGANP